MEIITPHQLSRAVYEAHSGNGFEAHKGISIQQPWAYKIELLEKWVEVRSRPTKYRGDFIVCASRNMAPALSLGYSGLDYGVTIAQVELYDCKRLADMTLEELAATCLPPAEWERYENHYGYMLRNVRPLERRPVRGQLGIFNLYCTAGYITP